MAADVVMADLDARHAAALEAERQMEEYMTDEHGTHVIHPDNPLHSSHEPLKPPLHRLAMIGDIVGLRRRLAAGADPNQWDSHHFTPLRQACDIGAYPDEDQEVVDRVECVRALLQAGADPNRGNDIRCGSPLKWAASKGQVRIVEIILQGGSDANATARATDDYYNTSLHSACVTDCRGHAEEVAIVNLLLQGGAAVNAPDYDGTTPLEYAIRITGHSHTRSRYRLYPILLRAGANLPRVSMVTNLLGGDYISMPDYRAGNAYLKRIVEAGSFAAYERLHVNALAASFAPKLELLPEVTRVVVAFAFHCGYYWLNYS